MLAVMGGILQNQRDALVVAVFVDFAVAVVLEVWCDAVGPVRGSANGMASCEAAVENGTIFAILPRLLGAVLGKCLFLVCANE